MDPEKSSSISTMGALLSELSGLEADRERAGREMLLCALGMLSEAFEACPGIEEIDFRRGNNVKPTPHLALRFLAGDGLVWPAWELSRGFEFQQAEALGELSLAQKIDRQRLRQPSAEALLGVDRREVREAEVLGERILGVIKEVGQPTPLGDLFTDDLFIITRIEGKAPTPMQIARQLGWFEVISQWEARELSEALPSKDSPQSGASKRKL